MGKRTIVRNQSHTPEVAPSTLPTYSVESPCPPTLCFEKGRTHFSKLELKRDKDSGEAALRTCAKRKAKRELSNKAQIVSIVKIVSFCYHVARVAKMEA